MKTIHDQWRDFCDAGGRNLAADEYQLHKMRCAFYGGALGVIEALDDMITNQESMDAGANAFSILWNECTEFARIGSAQN